MLPCCPAQSAGLLHWQCWLWTCCLLHACNSCIACCNSHYRALPGQAWKKNKQARRFLPQKWNFNVQQICWVPVKSWTGFIQTIEKKKKGLATNLFWSIEQTVSIGQLTYHPTEQQFLNKTVQLWYIYSKWIRKRGLNLSCLLARVSRNWNCCTFVRNSEFLLVKYFSFAYMQAKHEYSCFVPLARHCIYWRTCIGFYCCSSQHINYCDTSKSIIAMNLFGYQLYTLL